MTLKHINFADSAVMRSLERVAVKKGLIKEDLAKPLPKTASNQLDLTPSNDFMTNLLKLCSGLRTAGLESYAAEIETNYLNFKQAQTLYQAHKETGEDLINSAHPQGSHKLENVDSDEAVIETVLDQHLKILEKVNKKPTGKLSTASEVIKAVKVVLGQEYTDEQWQKYKKMYASYFLGTAAKSLKEANRIFKMEYDPEWFSTWDGQYSSIVKLFNMLTDSDKVDEINVEKLSDLMSKVSTLKNSITSLARDIKYVFVSDKNSEAVEKIKSLLDVVSNKAEGAINYLRSESGDAYDLSLKRGLEIQKKQKAEKAEKSKQNKSLKDLKYMAEYNVDNLTNAALNLNKYRDKLKKYPSNDQEYANNYIDRELVDINSIDHQFHDFLNNLSDGGNLQDKNNELNNLGEKASQKMSEVNKFYQQWISG